MRKGTMPWTYSVLRGSAKTDLNIARRARWIYRPYSSRNPYFAGRNSFWMGNARRHFSDYPERRCPFHPESLDLPGLGAYARIETRSDIPVHARVHTSCVDLICPKSQDGPANSESRHLIFFSYLRGWRISVCQKTRSLSEH